MLAKHVNNDTHQSPQKCIFIEFTCNVVVQRTTLMRSHEDQMIIIIIMFDVCVCVCICASLLGTYVWYPSYPTFLCLLCDPGK